MADRGLVWVGGDAADIVRGWMNPAARVTRLQRASTRGKRRVVVAALVLLLTPLAAPAASATTANADRSASLAHLQTKLSDWTRDAAATPSRSSDGSFVYSDPVGDADGDLAPDISTIVVTASGGRITFQVGVANLGPGLIDGDFLSVSLDTDRNPATGCSGTEIALGVLGSTLSSDYARLGRCTGSSYDFGTTQGSFSYSYSPGAGLNGPGSVTFSVSAADLGVTAFNFNVGGSYKGIYSTYYDFAGPFAFAPATTPAPPPATPSPTTPPPSTPPPTTPPPATVVCVVPKVVGHTLGAARILIFNANCTVGRVSKVRSSKRKGTVIAQAPHAGTTRAEGGQVNVIVSRGRH
jgi:hypothetical protein